MKLELVTLTGTKMDEEVYEVVIPTASGEIAVFPGHEPLVTLTVPGAIQVRRAKGDTAMEAFAVHGGIVEISGNSVKIMVDEAEDADDIVATEAEAALERAKNMLAHAKDEVSINEAQAMLNRHAVRLKVANLRRRHHS